MKLGWYLVFIIFISLKSYAQTNTWFKSSLTTHGTDSFKDISFSNDDVGLAIGLDFTQYNPRYITFDGGKTWTRQNWSYQGNACIHINKNGNAITAKLNLASSNLVRVSNNFADSWTTVAAPNINSQFGTKSCWIMSESEFYVAGAGGWGTDDGVYKKENGQWQHVLENVNATKIYFISEEIGFAGTEYGDLYRTLDSGQTWQNLNYPRKDEITKINAVTKDIIFIERFRTTDGGENWTEINYPVNDFHFFNELEAYGVSGSSDVYSTIDGGLNWDKISSNQIDDLSNIGGCCKKYIYFKNKIFGLANSEPNIFMINIDTSLSTAQQPEAKNVLYPNPTSGLLNITSPQVIQKVLIYNAKGRLLQTRKITSTTERYVVDVKSLSSGVYFLKTQTSNSEQIQKFIKN